MVSSSFKYVLKIGKKKSNEANLVISVLSRVCELVLMDHSILMKRKPQNKTLISLGTQIMIYCCCLFLFTLKESMMKKRKKKNI